MATYAPSTHADGTTPTRERLTKQKSIKMKCCICGDEITPDPVTGWRDGCNPWPLATDGVCCWKCDRDRVSPARVEMIRDNRERTKLNAKNGGM